MSNPNPAEGFIAGHTAGAVGMQRSVLDYPPGPPPSWWRAWYPPRAERDGACWPPSSIAAQALLWRAIAADAEARGDLPAAARALRQAEIWDLLTGRLAH